MISAGSIGSQNANELLDFNRFNSSPSSGTAGPCTPFQVKSQLTLAQTSINVPNGEAADPVLTTELSQESQGASFPVSEELMNAHSQLDLDMVVGPGFGNLGNDEAAMALIMSLFETEGELGEAVGFSEAPWSL
ncbi:aryl hydrocarbon receptor nuclear translocator-like protein 2 isoform X1 [Acipenser oxyrinchus oxyrinchus]|uniref:Aryl hydrocarbon receptor nuclear translocator-like protein 2 isoform X1 n=1 Tax=Acipenser oxyrinchus oxyrinchus TaxID=40147 RepID=A0AAD8DHV4_ACIOX|nr:aryl hydrocarbon receptor nuclear translocator-like protein 2 isoform X1 [Acipenser oxyrinchus oxyrinchus]